MVPRLNLLTFVERKWQIQGQVVVNSDIGSLINNSNNINLNNSITTRGETRWSRRSTEFRPESRHISPEVSLTTTEVVPGVATGEVAVNGNTNDIMETTG